MSNLIYESAKDTAKKIRVELKKAFPFTKFSVTSSRFAGGDAVDVSWDNYPTSQMVDVVLNRFKSGHFDGMTDMHISGHYEYEGQKICGAKHVHGQPNTTAEFQSRLDALSQEAHGCDFWKLDYQDPQKSAMREALERELYPDIYAKEAYAFTPAENAGGVDAQTIMQEATPRTAVNQSTGETFKLLVLNKELKPKEHEAFCAWFTDQGHGSWYPSLHAFLLSDQSLNDEENSKRERAEAYQEAREDKAQHYADLSKKASHRSDCAYQSARSIGDMIPFGQPILVGHHSEGRHRRDLGRIDSGMRKSIEESSKAEYYSNKANNALNNTDVKGDDPQAVEILTFKIQRALSHQHDMKRANALLKKKGGPDTQGLKDLGFKDEDIKNLSTPDFAGRIGFPSYSLTNNNANIKRMRDRRDALEMSARQGTTSQEHDGFEVVENAELNRVQILFEDIPPVETRTLLKSNGFKWSPKNSAWQRHLNNAGRYAVKTVVEKLSA